MLRNTIASGMTLYLGKHIDKELNLRQENVLSNTHASETVL